MAPAARRVNGRNLDIAEGTKNMWLEKVRVSANGSRAVLVITIDVDELVSLVSLARPSALLPAKLRPIRAATYQHSSPLLFIFMVLFSSLVQFRTHNIMVFDV
jgi:hypothetical protein